MSGALLRARSYQTEAIAAVEKDWADGFLRVAVVLATGLGKTHVFSHVIERAHREGKRALVLVHREELAEQAKTKLHSVAPHLSIGIVKAERNELDADVIVGSVQTLAQAHRRAALLGTIDLVVCDEAHHSVSRTWMEILTDFGCFDATPCLGVTATMARSDAKGLADVWQKISYEKDILYGIDNGYLTDVRGQQVTVDGLDLATVAKSRGDYQEGQLGEAMESAGAGEVIAQAYLEHASYSPVDLDPVQQVRQGVLFTPTVATAYSWAQSLRDAGIEAATIEGNTSSEDRKLIYKRYEEGEIRVLANAMVLCLDTETEILTHRGWVRHDEMTLDHKVANWDQGRVFFEKPHELVRRPLGVDEQMYVLNGKGRSVRVTGGHRMVYRTLDGGQWKKAPVEDLVGRSVQLPTVGHADPENIEITAGPVPTGHSYRAAAYNLRVREGYGYEESKVEARRRVDRRYGLRQVSPVDLTLDQCRFIGFWVGDGSRNDLIRGGVEYTTSQSTSYPKIIEWFDKIIASCGFDAVRRDKSGYETPHIRWSFPRGTGGGSQQRNGIYPIEPYLNKNGSHLLWGLNTEQFDAFLEGLWYADGEHRQAEDGYPRGWTITATRKNLIDRLQAIGAVRGMEMSVRRGSPPREAHHNQLWILTRSLTPHHRTAGIRFEPDPSPWRPEEVWCVKTTTRNIITRRSGTVTVMGNTEGWDAPWAEVAVIARPTQSAALYTQMVGRVLRPWRGKTEALVLDVVGVTGRHRLQSLTDLVKTEVQDGESYAEARIRVEREAAVRAGQRPVSIAGAISSVQVELFAQSHSSWLRTRRGTWFVPVTAGVFFLWDEGDGIFSLGYKHTRASERADGWIQRGLTLEYAMAWGEQLAQEDDPTVSLKDRKWRRTKPSQAQIDFALRIKAADPETVFDLRKGELSDLISVAVTSKMLDRFLS